MIQVLNLTTPETIKNYLHEALGKIEPFEQCILLDYPDHANIGDNLIWLGELLYLHNTRQSQITYNASVENFSVQEMDKCKSSCEIPIFLHGGGNLGDLWLKFQNFREYIISEYKENPIIIFPQSIYFQEEDNLIKAARIFNSHPNLTIFVRDNYSYQLATNYFSNCRIIKSPDAAFQLVNTPGIAAAYQNKSSILYHFRNDKELNLNQAGSPHTLDLPNLIVEDWASYKYESDSYKELPHNAVIQSFARVFHGWEQGKLFPDEWITRQIWKYFHPYTTAFSQSYNPESHRKAWSYMYQGVYQFKQHRLIITNRLHGHILSTLMGIPHIFLPNSYHKNEAFYEAWTYQIPFCRFVKDPEKIADTVRELIEISEIAKN
ncbi:Polysaccharide pyruvyl transferase [Trichormus variabilis ATCC 29413]|uniref:Polysaccharide pyruvyl transferase n=2 Tax=Anabaena variabilis TaxID=264691 RepID=Q3MEW7_TRIV2|nr:MULTISPECIES: polysaccharide pyruvyl transferase family protein [Nostocaceae]ABA20469.1 Polysaccharide pyruvyl transferase [Trichormus variabilis ATCC 29413]MBC1215806.1 polysaccharide pyruvyl transferase family protein [Trichormus variabilis ARAD]MBC1256854.1 polysaccharide pyruvyl transferase family protein [Trichormus variabilis V5]MBC1267984.1 polysaccharide pyruvyl transferase family protein [Trichormus variabilis FSR]MBC1304380.1 polysaccharide pyruvyl transferase family protein [Tric